MPGPRFEAAPPSDLDEPQRRAVPGLLKERSQRKLRASHSRLQTPLDFAQEFLQHGIECALEMMKQRAALWRHLESVAGYFSDDEAWALNRVVAEFVPVAEPLRVVEIGSYKGRSTIAIGLALKERRSGSCVSIDPHGPTGKSSNAREHGQENTNNEYLANIRSAGIAEWIFSIRATSAKARPLYDQRPIDVLFIDGSHDYEDVAEDIALWTSALSERSIVAFNDPFAPGVNRAIREHYLRARVPISRLAHVNNTLFIEISRGKPFERKSALH